MPYVLVSVYRRISIKQTIYKNYHDKYAEFIEHEKNHAHKFGQ